MSVEIPKVAIAFGSYDILQGDVVNCHVIWAALKRLAVLRFCCKTGMASIALAVLFR